jgi:hypothetical protein
VFANIGVSQPDVALAKTELARQMDRFVRAPGLTQAEVAAIVPVNHT